MMDLDGRIWTCEFEYKWLKFKYVIWIVLKDKRFRFDKSTKDFKGLKFLDL